MVHSQARVFHVKHVAPGHGPAAVCYAPPMTDTRSEIDEGLTALGIEHSGEQVFALERHLQLVAEANAAFNLTTIPPEQSVALHVMDSVVALPFLVAAPTGEFADLGSGAGFPGVPLAVLTGRQLTLVESVKKKAAFLESVVGELRLEATVQGVRAEELAGERPGAFAAVTARGVSSLPSLVELAAPLLAPDGLLICLKGAPEETELTRGDLVARRCGLTRVETAEVDVPGVEARRTIVVYRRTGPAGVSLPRRNGMAQRQPLA
jgi:16S rRNA (guanine527-N7)-methyltransferase